MLDFWLTVVYILSCFSLEKKLFLHTAVVVSTNMQVYKWVPAKTVRDMKPCNGLASHPIGELKSVVLLVASCQPACSLCPTLP